MSVWVIMIFFLLQIWICTYPKRGKNTIWMGETLAELLISRGRVLILLSIDCSLVEGSPTSSSSLRGNNNFFIFARKSPVGNDSIPWRTGDHREMWVPIAVSHRCFMKIESCNFSSSNLWKKERWLNQSWSDFF